MILENLYAEDHFVLGYVLQVHCLYHIHVNDKNGTIEVCFFRRRSKKISKLRVTGLCERKSPVTAEFSAQMANNAENISIFFEERSFISL